MHDHQRKLALDAWLEILERPASWKDAEGRYHALLKAADEMEQAELITSVEWRKLVRKAAASFVDHKQPDVAPPVIRAQA